MRLAMFKTVRGRLLALLVAITLPIACLTAIAAITTYRTVIASIEASQTRAANDFAVRTRVWYRGALRSLLASGTVIAGAQVGASSCAAAGREMLGQIQGYRAMRIVARAGPVCAASLDPEIGDAEMAGVAAWLTSRPSVRIWAGAELAQVRYDHVFVGNRRYLAVYARSDEPDRPMRDGLLLIAPGLLDQVFDLGDSDENLLAAMVAAGGTVVTARGIDENDASWLPAREIVPQTIQRWDAPSRSGVMRAYAARMVAEPDLYVIASFNDAATKAAQMQFLALLLAPLLTLALLCLVYLRAIDTHCVRWLRGIEAAARPKSTAAYAHAAIADDMPIDIRKVAEAFNMMVDEQEVRRRRLQTALDDNRFLVRELHHRVKNSLQVVQSYIGLTKRDYRGEARLALADAECRVHVLSAAYRFTLAEGEMQPVRIDLFLDDVVTMISNLIRRRDQWVSAEIETRAALPVDRIIPLGFLIVDVASRALRSTPGISVAIIVADIDDATIEVCLKTDRVIEHREPPRLFAGLVSQIEATQATAPEGAHLGAWRVRHR